MERKHHQVENVSLERHIKTLETGKKLSEYNAHPTGLATREWTAHIHHLPHLQAFAYPSSIFPVDTVQEVRPPFIVKSILRHR